MRTILLLILVYFSSVVLSGTTFYNVIIQRGLNPNTRDLLCSGALISYEKVLTAARCFFLPNHTRLPNEYFTVMVGNLGSIDENSRIIEVKDIFIHPNFAHKRGDDIAVVVLQTKIDLDSKDVMPIGVATYRLPIETECLMTTWLSFLSSWSIADYLQELPVVTVDSTKCSSNALQDNQLNKTLCVYGRNTTLDGVYFLPGTPLVCNSVLAGISFQTARYNQPISYVPFTDINYFWNWISKSMAAKILLNCISIATFSYCFTLLLKNLFLIDYR